jgi:transcriptional regulator with XRE-family HTH domain
MVTKVRITRIKTGLSLRAFAKTYGLSEVTLCRIEKGNQYIPPVWRDRLAKALNSSIDELCDEHGWPRLIKNTYTNTVNK